MNIPIEPIKVQSLKQACVRKLEDLILSGEFKIGERLPAERDLATQLNISRPILHEALVDLTAKGLVTIQPRRGAYINDFRTTGSVTLLASLLEYNGGQLDPIFIQSLIEMRLTMEVETARLAALRRTEENLVQFQQLLQKETALSLDDIEALTEVDFEFHLLVGISSGNLLYPLMINSFKSVYTTITKKFFSLWVNTPKLNDVFNFHKELAAAIAAQESNSAAEIMTRMLKHGEKYLKGEA